jgi:hypothetical protein
MSERTTLDTRTSDPILFRRPCSLSLEGVAWLATVSNIVCDTESGIGFSVSHRKRTKVDSNSS